MTRQFKVAIIGAGYTATEHARAFRDIPEVTLAGIFSRTRDRAELLASSIGITDVVGSVEELYERTEADLVIVTVPELAMRDVAVECFRQPWAVLLEKPPGYNLQTALEIEAAAQTEGSDVLVALNRRYMSSTRGVMRDLEESEGQRFIKVQDQEDQAAAMAAGQPEAVVRTWMYANSIHMVDYFTVLGRGTIDAVTPILPWNPLDPNVVLARIEFSSGDHGLYEGIWQGPGPWAVTVTTAERRWEMRPLEEASSQERGTRQTDAYPIHPWDRSFKPGFRLQAEEVVRHVSGGRSNAVTLKESIRTMRLISEIFQTD